MAPSFINKFKTGAKQLWNNAPSYLQKARTFATTAVEHAGKAHRTIQNVNRAVQDKPELFNENVRGNVQKFTNKTGSAVRKLEDLHKHGEDFIERVQGGDVG